MAIYLRTKSIYYSMLIHFINNAFIVIYTYYMGAGDGVYILSPLTVTVALLLAIVSCAIIYDLIKELPNEQKK